MIRQPALADGSPGRSLAAAVARRDFRVDVPLLVHLAHEVPQQWLHDWHDIKEIGIAGGLSAEECGALRKAGALWIEDEP